jgi:hypothetical protein
MRTAIGILLVASCGGHVAAPDAGLDSAVDSHGMDSPVPPPAVCPTSGTGALTPEPGSSCFVLTPEETGATASGENATVPSYALTAATAARGELVVFFNGSGGHPSGAIADPTINFYNAATALGYDVLAVSYPSEASLASLCGSDDGCYFPTRQSILLGVGQPGAAATVQAITLDEGVARRVVLALRELALRDPGHRWSTYLDTSGSDASPQSEIAWSKLVAAGHSQGGGHAAALGKLFPVARVIQLSSTCDTTAGAPASWTDGAAGTWASDPTQFFGLAAPTTFTNGQPSGGDTVCPRHVANWQHLGMLSTRQHDDAATCGATGPVAFHAASLKCTQNQAAWAELLQ